MALPANPVAEMTADKQISVIRTMRVMTACAAKFTIRPAWILFPLSWMPFYRMPITFCNTRVATRTEFIKRLVELKPIRSGMGAVTCGAAVPQQNTVREFYGAAIYIHLFINMAGKT